MNENVVQLWPVSLDRVSCWLDHRDWLDEAEQARADRYRNDVARLQFIRGRNALRFRLGQHLHQKPAAVRLTVSAHGKPRLLDEEEHARLGFNLSHTGTRLLLGLASRTEIGLDIETIKPRRHLERLVAYCLTPQEQACWQSLPPEQQLTAFTRYWASKEAFVKAVGRGIALGFCKVGVAEDFSGFEMIPPEFGPPDHWRLHEWRDGDVQVAVVYAGERRTLIWGDDLVEGAELAHPPDGLSPDHRVL